MWLTVPWLVLAGDFGSLVLRSSLSTSANIHHLSYSLYLKEEARDFLEPQTLEDLIKKYSQFINFNIYLWKSKTEDVEEPIEEAEEKKDAEKDEEKVCLRILWFI